MKVKISIIIIILILNEFIINLNSKMGAETFENDSIIIRNYSPIFQSNDELNWGPIYVLSEPIFGQNLNINYSGFPKIATEGSNIHVVWYDITDFNNSGGDYDIFYRKFNGTSWLPIEVISEPVVGKNLNIDDDYDPDITIKNGKVYVVWDSENNSDGSGTDYDIFYRANLGYGWGPIQIISEEVIWKNNNIGDSSNSKIAVENENIYVVWFDNNNTNNSGADYDIFFRCNSTGWGPIEIISEPIQGSNFNIGDSYDPEIDVENGKIYVVWRDMNNTNGAGTDSDIFYKYFNGSNWSEVQVISESVPGSNFNIQPSLDPGIVVENRNIFVVWYDRNDTNGAGTDRDIFYRCNLSGYSWEPVQVISEPIFGADTNTGESWGPKIAVKNNEIFVVWYDNNDTNGSSTDFDIFFKCNRTGIWEPVQVISEPLYGSNINTGFSFNPAIEVENGNINVVWFDSNNTINSGTDSDIFFRYTSLPSKLSNPDVTPKSGYTNDYFNFTVTYINTENKPLTEIYVNISGNNYSMKEANASDLEYRDGKKYYYNITHLKIGKHSYQFYANNSTQTFMTELFNNLIVYNSLPIIITPDNITAIEDVYYEVIYEFKDIDNITVNQLETWKFSSNASWLLFNPISTKLYGTPTNNDVGKYWVNVSINDTMDMDFTNYTLNVVGINDPPTIITIDNETAIEDQLYEIKYEAIDIDTILDNLIWGYKTNASWLKFDISNTILNGTPLNDDVGEYWVNISVADNEFLDFTNFSLIVVNVNDPPLILTPDITIAKEDEFYQVNYTVEDVDNIFEELEMTFTTDANWLTFNTTSLILSGTPLNDDVGEYWVNISVTDNEFLDFTNFSLIVVNVNDPPLILTPDITIAREDEFYQVNYTVEDVDNILEELELTFTTDANWLTFNTTSLILSGIPLNDDVGEYWVNISVADNEFLDFTNFSLIVENVNDPPMIITTNIPNATEDEYYEIYFEAEDVDNNPNELIWTINTNADWLEKDILTRKIFGIPINNDIGEYWVNISVKDEQYIDSANFIFVVENINDPPTIITLDKENITVGDFYSIHYEAVDIDPIQVDLTWKLNTDASQWLSINSSTGWLNGTPSYTEIGSYYVNVSVDDNVGGIDFHYFTLSVIQLLYNNKPELTEGKTIPITGNTNTEFTFSVHYSDIDGDKPSNIQVVIDGEKFNMTLKSGEIASNGTYEYKTKLSEGEHSYYFKANDGIDDAISGDDITPTIDSAANIIPEVTKPKVEKAGQDLEYWVYLLILIIIIILIILFFIVTRFKRKSTPAIEEETKENDLNSSETDSSTQKNSNQIINTLDTPKFSS